MLIVLPSNRTIPTRSLRSRVRPGKEKARLPVSISQQEQQEQDELKIKAKLYIVSLIE